MLNNFYDEVLRYSELIPVVAILITLFTTIMYKAGDKLKLLINNLLACLLVSTLLALFFLMLRCTKDIGGLLIVLILAMFIISSLCVLIDRFFPGILERFVKKRKEKITLKVIDDIHPNIGKVEAEGLFE